MLHNHHAFDEEYNKMKDVILKAMPQEINRLIAQYINNLNSFLLMTGTNQVLESLKELESHLNFGIWYLEHSSNIPNLYRVIHCLETTPILLHFYLPNTNNSKRLTINEIYLSNTQRLHQLLLRFSIDLLSTTSPIKIMESKCLLAFEIIQDLQIEYLVEDIEAMFIPILKKLKDDHLSSLIIIIDHYYVGSGKTIPQELLKLLEDKLNKTQEGILALDILVFFQNININNKEGSIRMMKDWQKANSQRRHFVWNSSDFDEGYDDLPWEEDSYISKETHQFLRDLLEEHSIESITKIMLSILHKKSWIKNETLKEIINRTRLSPLQIFNAIEKDEICVSKITNYISSKEPYKAVEIITEFLFMQNIINEEESSLIIRGIEHLTRPTSIGHN